MKLKLYIRDIDLFLKGEYDTAFTVFGGDSTWQEDFPDSYIFVSDVNVSVEHIDKSHLTEIAVKMLDEQIEKEKKEFDAKLELLKRKKKEFLAITYQEGA